jgi:hypothetical protein
VREHTKIPLVAATLLVLLPSGADGQRPEPETYPFATGATLATGVGWYAVRDEFLSRDRYHGRARFSELSWTRFRGGAGSRLAFGFRAGTEVESNRVSSIVTTGSLSLEYFYRVGRPTILGRGASLFLGPSAGISAYVNDQEVASNGLDLAVSFASLISIGVASAAVVELTRKAHLQAAFRLDVVSVGARIVDLIESDESPVKVLPFTRGTEAVGRVGFGFDAFRHIALGVHYQTRFLRISSWDHLVAASDSVVVSITLR